MAKKKVPKTRCNGTMTEAAFFGMIRGCLRRAARFWKPATLCKTNARRAYKGKNKRQRWEYQCCECGEWFKGDEVQVDHIIPCGTLRCFDDIGPFCERLFCEVDGFQVMCKPHHQIKTNREREERKV